MKKILSAFMCLLTIVNFGLLVPVSSEDITSKTSVGVEMYTTNARHMSGYYSTSGGTSTSNSTVGTTVKIDTNADGVYDAADTAWRYILTKAGASGDPVYMNYGVPSNAVDNGGNNPGCPYKSFDGYAGTHANVGYYWDMPKIVKGKTYQFTLRAKAPAYITDSTMESENVLYVDKVTGSVKVKSDKTNGMIGAPLGFRINTNKSNPNTYGLGTFTGYLDEAGNYVPFTAQGAKYTQACLRSEYVDYVGYFVATGQTKDATVPISQDTIIFADSEGEGLWYIDEISIKDIAYTIGTELEEISALGYSYKSSGVTEDKANGKVTVPADNNISYTFDVERAGYYKVLMYAKYVGSAPNIKVTGSDKEVVNGGGIRSSNESPKDGRYTICRLYLKKGVNHINFAFTNGGAEIKSLFLKCVDRNIYSVGTNIIEAHDYYTSNINTVWEEDAQYNYRNDYNLVNSDHSMRGPVVVSSSDLGRTCKYRINVAESAQYKLRAYAAGTAGRVLYGEFYVLQNDKELASGVLKLDNVHPETNMGVDLTTFNLSAGLQEIDITAHISQSNMFIYYYTLEKVAEEQITATISVEGKNELQAENIFYNDTGVTKGTETATISTGSTANFDIGIESDGDYIFSVKYKSLGGALTVKNDNNVLYNKVSIPTAEKFVIQTLFVSKLQSGLSRISMTSEKDIEIDEIYITKIADEETLSGINLAKNEEEIESAIKAIQTALDIDIEDVLEGIFYKVPIYNRLLKNDFKTVEDFINEYNMAVLSEYSQPWASLYINGEKTTEIKSGNMIVKATTGYVPENATMITAIYEVTTQGNKLYKCSMCEDKTYNDYEFVFGQVQIDTNKNYIFKFFYWDEENGLKPVEVFNSVFREIHVETDGDDATADGSPERPYKTIVAAMDKVAEINKYQWGDIVVSIGNGVHTLDETLYINETHSGKNGFNVIVRGDNNIQPTIISGGIQVKNWQEHQNGIWKAPLSGVDYARNLYVNGYPAVMARSATRFDSAVLYQDDDSTWEKDGLTMKIADIGTTFARPQDLGLVFTYLHKTFISPVEAAITTDTDITFLIKREVFNLSPTSKTGSEFYIENAYELLDEAGEFYYNVDEGMIYYKPYPGEDLLSAETYVGAVEGLVNVSGSSLANKVCNITFENLTFRYGAYDFISKYGLTGHQADGISSSMFTAENGQTAYFAQFAVNNADNINIKTCEFSCLGSAAISMIDSVSNSMINGNIIRDIAGTGIRIGAPSHHRVDGDVEVCRDIDITNNVLRRTSSESFNNTAISIYYEKYINVSNNDIGSLPYTGITAGWGWQVSVPHDCSDIIISNNKITDVMQTLDDGGGIYTLGTMKNSIICGNYLRGHASISGGMIYNDAGSAYIDVHDNVILDATVSLHTTFIPGSTRHLNYYNNYANNLTQIKPENKTDVDENGVTEYEKYYTSIVMEDLKDVDSYLSETARIESEAGLTEDYIYLLEKVEEPNGRLVRYILPDIPVSEEIIVSSENFNSSTSTSGLKADAMPDGLAVNLDNGEHVSYNVTIPKSGWYKFLVYGRYEGEKPNLTVSGTMTKSVLGTNPGIGGVSDGRWTIGRFYFGEGVQEIKLSAATNSNGENGTYVIKELIFKCVEHTILPNVSNLIEVHDYYTSDVRTQYNEDIQWYYYSSSPEYFIQGPVIADSEGRTVTYKMHIEEAGDYRIDLSTYSKVAADFNVYYKNDVLATAQTPVGDPVTAVFESVALPAGDIELTFECKPKTKGNVFMYYFTIKKINNKE